MSISFDEALNELIKGQDNLMTNAKVISLHIIKAVYGKTVENDLICKLNKINDHAWSSVAVSLRSLDVAKLLTRKGGNVVISLPEKPLLFNDQLALIKDLDIDQQIEQLKQLLKPFKQKKARQKVSPAEQTVKTFSELSSIEREMVETSMIESLGYPELLGLFNKVLAKMKTCQDKIITSSVKQAVMEFEAYKSAKEQRLTELQKEKQAIDEQVKKASEELKKAKEKVTKKK